MKKPLILIFAIAGSTLFSQDLIKTFQQGKWYADGYVAKKTIKLTRKPLNDKQVATAEFLPSGKINYCDNGVESYFDANGNETLSPAKFYCNTVDAFEVKNNMIHIYWNDVKHWYFKVVLKGETMDLTPIKAEDFK